MKGKLIILLIGMWLFFSMSFITASVGSMKQVVEFMSYKKQLTSAKFIYVECFIACGITVIWFIVSPKAVYRIIQLLKVN